LIGKTLAHYEILASLGQGGMGEVYRARDTRLGRDVALKVLPAHLAQDADRIARFRREAQAVASLNHPHIVTVHSVDEADGTWFLTMELVEGIDGTALARQRLEASELVDLARALAEALATAHDRGVVHRDLKPANVMRTVDGRAKILDFGLAKLETSSDQDQAATAFATAQGSFLGTRAYMSPEQLRGESATAAADVFALGMTLYEIASGTHPFPAGSEAERQSAILRDAPRPLDELRADLPENFTRTVEACMDKDPRKRPSARAVEEALASSVEAEAKDELNSVAVLSFADLSPDHDQDYLCDGLAEELRDALTRIEGLNVASRTSCLQYRNVAGDIRDIGQKLGVSTVVEGSVRKAGSRLRISARLTKVSDGYQLWADQYDRELEDVFEIQEDIARRVVKALQLTLSPRERRALQNVQTTNPVAYEYYLRGRHYHHRLNREGLLRARDMFEKAIEIDPHYARAYAGIADCIAYLFMLHRPDPSLREVVAQAAQRAVELDPQLPEAHVAQGQAHLVNGDYSAACEVFQDAIRLDPRSFEAHYFLGRASFGGGDLDTALRAFETAAELKPDDHQSSVLAALVHRSRGNREREVAAMQQSLDRLQHHLALYPDDVRAIYFYGSSLIGTGQKEEGLKWLDKALALAPDDAHVGYNVACAFTNAGEYERAMECLESVLDGLKASHYYGDWLRNDPDFKPLWGTERFEEFRAKLLAGGED
jgi:serine/threonine protein kinase/cytochrome c-type biogenesis protein CcmH/NrfG